MQYKLFPASERGKKDIGWLVSNFFLSFSDYASPDKAAFGTLFAFNDDYVAAGKGFGTHPHINMEIISILLKGTMNHKDNLGYSTTIQEDGVQIMSAGSGLFHEEYNIGATDVNFLQIWILPKQQNIRPRYQLRSFPKDKRKNTLQTIVSSEEGQEHCWINQNAKLSLGSYEDVQQLNYKFNPLNKCLFIFSIKGTVQINGHEVTERSGIGIWDTDNIDLTTTSDCEFLIIETVVNQK